MLPRISACACATEAGCPLFRLCFGYMLVIVPSSCGSLLAMPTSNCSR